MKLTLPDTLRPVMTYPSVKWLISASNNGLLDIWHQTINWSNVDLLSIEHTGINFSGILINIH